MDINQEVEEVKKELLEIIISQLKENKIEVQKAQDLAQNFLASLPIKDHKDLLTKLKTLGQYYPQVSEVYTKELIKTEEEKRDDTLEQIRGHIKNGNIEQAITAAKSMSQT